MAETATTGAPVTQVTSENPIINDPFEEPACHWEFGEGAPRKAEGRREAGYIPPAPKGQTQLRVADELVRLPHVNRIRDRVRDWRESGYPGATQVTRELFRHWFDPERERRPYFAQREAIETIAFLTEAPASRTEGIDVPGSGEAYARWAVKLATGGGKTLVMAMTIAWSGLNKVAAKQDARFADAFLVVCPNLTVKERLEGDDGINPAYPASAFEGFGLIPGQFEGMLGQVKVLITNWHALKLKEESKYRVLKRGIESDAAFCRRVLGGLGNKRRIMVINDEAHHAWRPPSGLKATGEEKKELEEATVWVSGLERIHKERGIIRAVDFSATPMYPGAVGGEKAWTPFEWVVSDFGLVDAIESGMVKIPRIPTTDDSGTAVPKYRNLWEAVKAAAPKPRDDPENEGHPMYDYLTEVDGPLKQLAGEWHNTFERWEQAGRLAPPVMIVVCNDTKMARLVDIHIAERGEAGPWLQNREGETNTVRIDSGLLDSAEARLEGESAQDAAERLRELVSTVGKEGKPGEQVRCLVSVGMLSEGWDARNVTQILGLRAFQSNLLCEQVVGRGLRRSDNTDLSRPEYVDVYGVPFQLLPFAKAGEGTVIEPPKTTRVHSLRDRKHLRLEFPRVEQVIHDFTEDVEVDLDAIEPILVSPENDPTSTWVEFEVGAARAGIGGETQDRTSAYERFRPQRAVFRIAADIANESGKRHLFPHLARLVQSVVDNKVEYTEGVDPRELCNLRYIQEIRNRTVEAFRSKERDRLIPVLNEYESKGSTDCDFQTVKDCFATTKSHISHAVVDSGLEWEAAAALEESENVVAYAKNDRLFLEIPYRHLGATGRYRPDFLIKLSSGLNLVIETKGRKREKDDAKITAARRWVEAVNNWGEMGSWKFVVCRSVGAVREAVE